MSPIRSITTVLALGALCSVAACGAAPTSEQTGSGDLGLSIVRCPTGYAASTTDCEPGPGGKMLCETVCDTPIRPYSSGIATPGAAVMYDGPASTYLWTNGCSTSATFTSDGTGPAYFTCPSTFRPTQSLGWFAGVPVCVLGANGEPSLGPGQVRCEALFVADDMTRPAPWTNGAPASSIGIVKSNVEYVWVTVLTLADIYGTGCGAPCSILKCSFP